jgi:hypothetical protein
MPLIKEKLSDVLLKRIRAQREPANGDSISKETVPAGAAKAISIREVQFSDFEQVSALNLRLGQGPDSPENWRRLWVDNPALADGKGSSPIGWMLQTSSGEVVGFIGTIPQQYEFEGNALRAAATCRFAVESAYRGSSHLLVMSYFRQKNVDLFLNTTATVEAGKMMLAHKAAPLPQRDYDSILFWVLDPRRFTKEVFRKLGVKSFLTGPASAVASLAVKGDAATRGRAKRAAHTKYTIKEISIRDMGQDFSQLWADAASAPARLSAKRCVEIMRWHFDPPHNRRKVSVLACTSGNDLAGYAIVRHEQEMEVGLRRSLIADMMLRDNDPMVLEHLLVAACQSSKASGSHVLEAMGFPQSIRQNLMKFKPYTRKYPASPFFYKAPDKKLHEALANENAWYASPYDGDATIWP